MFDCKIDWGANVTEQVKDFGRVLNFQFSDSLPNFLPLASIFVCIERVKMKGNVCVCVDFKMKVK